MKVKASFTWEVDGNTIAGSPGAELLDSLNDFKSTEARASALLGGSGEGHGDLHQLDIGGYNIKDADGNLYGYVHVEEASVDDYDKYEHWALFKRFFEAPTAGKKLIFAKEVDWTAESDFKKFLTGKGKMFYISVDCHKPVEKTF